MFTFAIVLYIISFVGILGLFAIKAWEVRRGRRFVPQLRERADQRALVLKTHLLDSRSQIERIVPFMLLVTRYVVHEGALALAAVARSIESGAYWLADFVSHKRRFERRVTKSKFLTDVSGRVNGTSGETEIE